VTVCVADGLSPAGGLAKPGAGHVAATGQADVGVAEPLAVSVARPVWAATGTARVCDHWPAAGPTGPSVPAATSEAVPDGVATCVSRVVAAGVLDTGVALSRRPAAAMANGVAEVVAEVVAKVVAKVVARVATGPASGCPEAVARGRAGASGSGSWQPWRAATAGNPVPKDFTTAHLHRAPG
jgi:hypothetical protein